MMSLPRVSTKLFIFVNLFILFFLFRTVRAEDSSTISVSVDVLGSDIRSGQLVSIVDGNYVLSFEEYDQYMYGVVVEDSPLSLEDTTLDEKDYIVTSGETIVKVTAATRARIATEAMTSTSVKPPEDDP